MAGAIAIAAGVVMILWGLSLGFIYDSDVPGLDSAVPHIRAIALGAVVALAGLGVFSRGVYGVLK